MQLYADLIAYLHWMLGRQLADLRKLGHDRQSGGARVVEAEKKLIICAVKKPLKLSESQDGESRVSTDRLAVAAV